MWRRKGSKYTNYQQHTGLQCGRHWEQTRNDQDICRPRTRNKWKEDQNPTIDNGTRERTNYPGIPLQSTESWHQLENREIYLAKDRRKKILLQWQYPISPRVEKTLGKEDDNWVKSKQIPPKQRQTPCINCLYHKRTRRNLDKHKSNHSNPVASRSYRKEEDSTTRRTNSRRISWIPGCIFWRKGCPIPWTTILGSQNWTERTFYRKILQNIQPHSTGTDWFGQVLERKLGQRIYTTITITHNFTILLCGQERWKTSTLPRLSIFEWTHHQECISPTSHYKTPW